MADYNDPIEHTVVMENNFQLLIFLKVPIIDLMLMFSCRRRPRHEELFRVRYRIIDQMDVFL